MEMDIFTELAAMFPDAGSRLKEKELMSEYTTFRLGGPADCLFLPSGISELKSVLEFAANNKIIVTLLGRGSNVIISDSGIRGLTIMISEHMSSIVCEGSTLIAEAGASLAALSGTAANSSLCGLEFASGIPGAVGGGVMMNAGAYDGCLADSLIWTEYLDENNELKRLEADQHEFGYRSSFFTGSSKVIVRSAFELKPGSYDSIITKMADLAARRRTSQPLEKPSAGSAFKRPVGHYAGKLISDCGLKGYTYGGAGVSEKHAGFIVNLGSASASDVLAVFCHVQRIVFKETGVLLEPEVRFAGDWNGDLSVLTGCHSI